MVLKQDTLKTVPGMRLQHVQNLTSSLESAFGTTILQMDVRFDHMICVSVYVPRDYDTTF
jgi:hypothetical protein